MKRTLCWMLLGLLLVTLLAGCTANTPGENTPAASDGMYVLFRNTKVSLGMNYADVKEGLGEESGPAQDVLPCDGNEDGKTILHFYPGFAVTENVDGVIVELEISELYEGEGDAALMGKVKIGATQEEAIAALGEPNNYPLPEDDYGLMYGQGNQYIGVFLDPDSNKEIVSSISMLLMEP